MHQGNNLYVLIPWNQKSFRLNRDLQNNLFEAGVGAGFQALCVVSPQASILSPQFSIRADCSLHLRFIPFWKRETDPVLLLNIS